MSSKEKNSRHLTHTKGFGLASAALMGACGIAVAAPPSLDANTNNGDAAKGDGAANPLEQIYVVQQERSTAKPADQRQVYEKILKQHDLDSFWGQWAGLGMIRWHLAAGNAANPEAAQAIINRLPESLSHQSFNQQRDLWQSILAIHNDVDRMLEADSYRSSVEAIATPNSARIPLRLQAEMQWAITLIARRFEQNQQAKRGVECFQQLVAHNHQPTLQAAILKNLANLQLAGGNVEAAAVAARAYWLTCADNPSRLSQAIDTVTAVMDARGATPETIRGFRRQQMRGSSPPPEKAPSPETAQVAILQPSTVPDQDKALFTEQQITEVESILDRARLRLLNGNLQAAAPMLQQTLSAPDTPRAKRHKALQLVRMAFALRDGHMHRIGRYERYLAQGGAGASGDSGDKKNPLKTLIDDTGQQASVTSAP